MLYKLFGGLVVLVAVVSLMAGPGQAAETAGKASRTIGITAGAVVGSIPNLIKGFNQARGASGEDTTNRPARLERDRRGGGGRANG